MASSEVSTQDEKVCRSERLLDTDHIGVVVVHIHQIKIAKAARVKIGDSERIMQSYYHSSFIHQSTHT